MHISVVPRPERPVDITVESVEPIYPGCLFGAAMALCGDGMSDLVASSDTNGSRANG